MTIQVETEANGCIPVSRHRNVTHKHCGKHRDAAHTSPDRVDPDASVASRIPAEDTGSHHEFHDYRWSNGCCAHARRSARAANVGTAATSIRWTSLRRQRFFKAQSRPAIVRTANIIAAINISLANNICNALNKRQRTAPITLPTARRARHGGKYRVIRVLCGQLVLRWLSHRDHRYGQHHCPNCELSHSTHPSAFSATWSERVRARREATVRARNEAG